MEKNQEIQTTSDFSKAEHVRISYHPKEGGYFKKHNEGLWRINFFFVDQTREELFYCRHQNWGKDNFHVALERHVKFVSHRRVSPHKFATECETYDIIINHPIKTKDLIEFYLQQGSPRIIVSQLSRELRDLRNRYPKGTTQFEINHFY